MEEINTMDIELVSSSGETKTRQPSMSSENTSFQPILTRKRSSNGAASSEFHRSDSPLYEQERSDSPTDDLNHRDSMNDAPNTSPNQTIEVDPDPMYYIYHEITENCTRGRQILLKLWGEKEATTVALAFQYIMLFLAGFRSSIVSVIYVLYWQITVPLLLSRHRLTTVKHWTFRVSQLLLLILAGKILYNYKRATRDF